MACTRQSALEYIQNGRRLLVERLQNLSLIVENLFQRKVLQEEEVSKIQAEVDRFDQTRKILDWVTAKGEAACYELLMILDITRKRTLDNADLQQWISCFPFKEDPEMSDYLVGSKPCHRYQSQLKCKARKITEAAWRQSCSLLPERYRNEVTFSYTPLVLDTDVPSSLSKIETKSKRCKKARPKKLKSFIPVAKQETSPTDLLKTPKRRILLVGKPGIGKTAVAHQMLNLWAQKDHRELDYMFYFDVRDISPSTHPMRLEDLLFNMYSEPEESREEVLQDIKKNSENVVIIFDGITDLSSHSVIKKLVDKDLLLDAKIVITCRPEVPSGDFLTDWLSFRVEVKGFSNESIRAYLTKMLSAEPNPTPNHDSLSIVLNNLELFSLCHVPMYALMVVACMYYSTQEASKQPWPTTKMYINILRYCILKHSGKQMNDLDKCLAENREKILSLAEMAFDATQQKTMNLTELSYEVSSVQFSFLRALIIMVEPTVSDTYFAFLHYTMQEFFGALWLLQNPDKIRDVLQKCQTEEWKHTKHMVPFMCGLLNERNIRLVNGLVPAQQIKKTSDWFFKEVVNTFLPLQTNQDHAEGGAPEFERDLLFLCQCLYESQSTEACLLLLDKLDYTLDLDEEHLDPHQCCAVSYMISQSAERKVDLDLNSCTVSDQGLRLILGSLKNVRYLRSDPSMLCQLWTTLLRSEADIDFTSLLGLCGNELHLPFQGERRVFVRAEEVMKQSLERVNLCLHWDRRTLLSEALSKTILKCLTHINKLHFTPLQDQRESPEKLEKEEKAVLLDLCLQAGLCHRETFQGAVNTLLSLFSVYQTERYDILLDLYSHVKYNRKQAGRSILPSLRPLYQPAPAVWSIDLSERKVSLLLEVLKLQPEKKSVELKGWSDEEREVRSFLQCLPYISHLRFAPPQDQIGSPEEWRKREKTFLLNLCLQAALHERETIQTTVEKVLSLSEVYHDQKWELLLHLYSHVKDYETQTGRSVLPALQTVYQSAPAVWCIDLSERKASLLLEVLKLQPEKKSVELWDWSDEESEVRSFLQCLPYISQLSFYPWWSDPSKLIKFLVGLLSQAAEWEEQSGEKTLKLVSSVCTYRTFPFCDGDDEDEWFQCDLLLDLYSHVEDYETKTGRSVLPSLRPLYQSAPAVWSIDLSERKASLLLEVLKLQPEKKPVQLKGWSDEESEVRSFLQCLPYISQLSFCPWWSDISKLIKFLVGLLSQAVEWEEQSGEKTLKLVSSVCTYRTFPFCDGDDEDEWFQCDLLLDLYSHVEDYETKTGRSVLPSLRPLYQSAPAVWSIDLSERKASLLLEVLKLQPEKKPVQLKGWSDEESEVRSFLQCLPYISQLSCDSDRFFQRVCESIPVRSREDAQLLASLLQALGSTLSLGGQLPRKTCRSVVRVLGLCASRVDLTLTPSKMSLKGASLLFTHVSQLHKLRLNVGMAVRLARLARRTGRGGSPLTVTELSLVLKSSQPPERVLSRALSSVASLLRLWTVQCLDLTDFCIQGHSLITLLCHQGPLTLRLHSDTLQQLAVVVYEAQDKDLTRWFLEKVGGDLTSCRLDWEVLLSLLQHSTHNITVDLRKNRLLEKNISDLFPFLGRVIFKRLSSSFVKSTIRQIYDSRASDCVSSLLRSSDHWINLNSRELDRVDCTALCFTLQHSHQVKVNLLWTSIPPGEIESILPLLDRVSQLSVDRMLLLSFLHSCAASQILQGALSPPSAITTAAAELLRALQHRLDFSCSSSVDLSAHDQGEALCLTTDHCRAINSVLKQSQHSTQLVQNPTQNQSRNQPQVQLILKDCEVEHGALRELLPILHIVKLSPSKALLLQLVDHVCEGIEEGVLRYAESLCRALDGELDLSETRLNQKACGSLALVLEHSEGLSELDLSHCQLTDRHLQPLLTHLHKVEVLDLSHNDITDALTDRILQLVSTNTSIRTVRLFSNTIKDRSPFLTDKRFDIW
ncbi:uncharacterized protein LOC110498597 isoform X5 [Oncorhynchus mykiss]|uniref:uncharacterized protein LOC110498597 isoform X5 n=1 Tax=Oncorhynchus mykiss TaxID=8022 RepID=UPI001877F122|nr:uncharacterized protein LOC110498597 isoform X5 [Oncorhynchus mykiss]